MRFVRMVVFAGAALVLLALPRASLADHCGGIATVEPPSGPAGTTFLFRTNQGGPTNLYVYRDDKLLHTDTLAGDGFVTYRIRTAEGDEGRWRVRAAVQGQEGCYGEARFRVTGLPDTSTAAGSPIEWIVMLAILIGGIAFVAALRLPRTTWLGGEARVTDVVDAAGPRGDR